MTIRIIGVNAVALVILVIGILYLGQYQSNLIEAKLETFEAEVALIAAALSEGAVERFEDPAALPLEDPKIIHKINPDQARRMVRRLSQTMGKRIRLFDDGGLLIADSHMLVGPGGLVQIVELQPPDDTLYTVQVLKSMARFLINMLPDRAVLPTYPDTESDRAEDYTNATDALEGKISMSAWRTEEDGIFLSAAAPLITVKRIIGAVMLSREGQDIEEAIGQVWLDVLRVFAGTLVVTILLSIYLTGAIARPLRKLAQAAEDVRTGKSKDTEIPDLSYRRDEIGELSIVLRDMTQALWDKMDTIERFAADVAHELKNPLTSLRSAVETAEIVKKKTDRARLLGIIKHDVERMDRLISDISHASRLDTELSREAFRPIDLKRVLNELIDIHKDPLERESNSGFKWQNASYVGTVKVQLGCEKEADIFVSGIEGRLEQVFQNLISNAVSFAPEKTVVNIFVKSRRNRVFIEVSDQGPGIPENKLEHIFDRFYSERPEHEAYGKHSGLGLSICKQIITAHGGHIYAENIKGEAGRISGARFTVILNRIKI